MKEDIRKILEAGCQAPSGSNSQPWKFKINGNEIKVFGLPEKDHLILNFRNRGTWVAHGALLENIEVAANHFGYKTKTEYFPEGINSKLVLKILIEKKDLRDNEDLYAEVLKRVTNRKPYINRFLSEKEKLSLMETATSLSGAELKLIEDKEKIKILAKSSSTNEIVMFENKLLNKLFFEEIVWTEKDEKEKMSGLYLRTMELKLPEQLFLRLYKYWPIANLLNNFGFAKMIAKSNAKIYSSVSAIGAIVVEDKDEAFIDAGRLLEKIWLKATNLGLDMHLMTGALFFWQRIKEGDDKDFSEKHIGLIKKAYQDINSVVGAPNDKLTGLLFRIGEGGEPSARSSRMPLDKLIMN